MRELLILLVVRQNIGASRSKLLSELSEIHEISKDSFRITLDRMIEKKMLYSLPEKTEDGVVTNTYFTSRYGHAIAVDALNVIQYLADNFPYKAKEENGFYNKPKMPKKNSKESKIKKIKKRKGWEKRDD